MSDLKQASTCKAVSANDNGAAFHLSADICFRLLSGELVIVPARPSKANIVAALGRDKDPFRFDRETHERLLQIAKLHLGE